MKTITDKQAINRTKFFIQNSGYFIDCATVKNAVNRHKSITIEGKKYNTFGQLIIKS